MFREGDSLVFQRVTGGIRKPIVRFRFASGRQVELLAFHLEPVWAYTGGDPRPVLEEVVRRLYPNETPVVVTPPEQVACEAFLCVAYLYSDTPARRDSVANYSFLLVCGLVERIGSGVRALVSELLSRVDWEASATDDFLW